MRSKILLVFMVLPFFVKPTESFAQVNVQDSLALVDYYDSTYNVSPWQFGQSWDLQTPVNTWLGIGVSNNRVVSIKLWGGGRGGHIPSSFGNLTALQSIEFLDYQLHAPLPESFENLVSLTSVYFHAVFRMLPFPVPLTKVPNLKVIDMEDNYFTGSLPSSMGNMTKLETLNLFQNSLSGPIPTNLNSLTSLKSMDISYNKYTFKDVAPFVSDYITSGKTYSLGYTPQANISIHSYQGKLAVSAGGNLSDDTFKWFKDSVLIGTITGDSTYSPTEPGKYYVEVTNSVATDLTLYANEIMVNYQLPTSTITTTQTITGTDPVYITNGIFQIVKLHPLAGPTQLTGNVTATVTVNSTIPVFHEQPFLQKHYDITPSVNAGNSVATVTLYFTQQDFGNYNDYVTVNQLELPLLPTGGVNNGNVRITQFHGSFAGSSNPENYYDQDFVLITPAVSWDNINNWWAVTFPVFGFSGFFLNTINSALPLSLLSFSGKHAQNEVILQWETANEINTKQFIVQRNNGGVFSDIGTIPAQSVKGINNYSFTDKDPHNGNNFYRLKMKDIDGHFSFSDVITINFRGNNTSFRIYPNPSSSLLNMKIVSEKSENTMFRITDASGKSIYQKIITINAGTTYSSVNIENLPAGVYYLNINVNGKSEKVSFVKD